MFRHSAKKMCKIFCEKSTVNIGYIILQKQTNKHLNNNNKNVGIKCYYFVCVVCWWPDYTLMDSNTSECLSAVNVNS